MKIAVVILAGGDGRRIGGRKPQRLLGRKAMIDRATTLAAQWSDTVAVAVRDGEQADGCELRRILDEPGVEGPLAGLVAGLRFALAADCDSILSIPADMPFLPSDFADRMTSAIGEYRVAVAESGGRLHPVCGLWRTSALEHVSHYLASGQRSLKGFAAILGFQAVEWPVGEVDSFFNINSEEDLAVAERLIAKSRGS